MAETTTIVGKKWWMSKTTWANIIEISSGVVAIIAGILTDVNGAIATGGAMTIYGIIGIILRRITSSPIIK